MAKREKHYWTSRSEKECICTAGCISGVLHLFDFHHHHCHAQPRMQPQQRSSNPGIEAPRNSMESEYYPASLSSSTITVATVLPAVMDRFPAGIHLQYPPSRAQEYSEKDSSPETSGSKQGSRTPNVVARLMGLEPLPADIFDASPRPPICSTTPPMGSSHGQHGFPSISLRRRDRNLTSNGTTVTTSKMMAEYDTGVRSLPATPRISSARRSDVGPRLSLQLNKEIKEDVLGLGFYKVGNLNFSRDATAASSPSADCFTPPSPLFKSRKWRENRSKGSPRPIQDENRSPAKEMAKNAKESAKRRAGLLEVTNILSSRNCQPDDNTSPKIRSKARKMKKISRGLGEEPRGAAMAPAPAPATSPRLRLSEPKAKRTAYKDCRQSVLSDSPNSEAYPNPKTNLCSITPPSPSLSAAMTTPALTPQPAIRNSERSKSKTLPKSIAKCRKASCERFSLRPVSPSPPRTTPGSKKFKLPRSKSNHLLDQIHPTGKVAQIPRLQQQVPLSRLWSLRSSPVNCETLLDIDRLVGSELAAAGRQREAVAEEEMESESMVPELECAILDSLVWECLLLLLLVPSRMGRIGRIVGV